jgi:integral membrane sensor domain MASE1
VETALKGAPAKWQHWWWVRVAGELIFIPLIFVMTGRWSPRRARRDADEHQQAVEAEMSQLAAQTAG